MDANFETSAVLSIIAGAIIIGTGMWCFLPEKTQKILGVVWAVVRAVATALWKRK
jgi:hypothetical protein